MARSSSSAQPRDGRRIRCRRRSAIFRACWLMSIWRSASSPSTTKCRFGSSSGWTSYSSPSLPPRSLFVGAGHSNPWNGEFRLSARQWLWRVVLETCLFVGFGLVFAAGAALLLYFGFRFLAGWRFGLLSFIVGSIVVLLIEVCSAVSESARDAAESYMTRRTTPIPESSPRLEPSTGNAKEFCAAMKSHPRGRSGRGNPCRSAELRGRTGRQNLLNR